MKYLTLELLKRHCNVDQEFTDDDLYISWLGDVAEATVAVDLCCPLEVFEDAQGKIPAPICHAMMLYVGDLYANREVNAYTNVTSVPFGYQYLLDKYRVYADVTSEAFLNEVLVNVLNRLEIEKDTGKLILHQNPDDYRGTKGKAMKLAEENLLVDAGRLYLMKENN